MKVICEVFKSPHKDEMYLYVDKKEGLKRVPKELLEIFGKPKSVMTMLIREDKDLARVKSEDVLREIREKGFYLQMPPKQDEYLLDLYKAPTEGKY